VILQNHRIESVPFRGAPQTVHYILKGALQSQDHPEVRSLSEHICQGIRSKDYLSEYLAVYNFVHANTRYMRDPKTVELVKSPYLACRELLAGGRPALDCDCLTALLAALFLAAGAQVRVLTVAFRNMFYKGQRQYSHVLVQAYEPRSQVWITFDPVAGLMTADMRRRAVAVKVWPVA
jgi:hypothetical protein